MRLSHSLSILLFADYASRGQKKFGDKCENTLECGFPGSICDPKKKSCQCTEDLPVTNHIDKCGKGKLETEPWERGCLSHPEALGQALPVSLPSFH